MTVWRPYSFGDPVPGSASLIATGTTQDSAQPLVEQVSVFLTVPAGSGVKLPSSYSPGVQIKVLNRGVNALTIYPAPGDQIENYGINQGVIASPGGNIILVSFDPPLVQLPRTWWMDAGNASISVPGGEGLINDHGVLTVLNSVVWPSDSFGLPPGALYSNRGVVSVVLPVSPDPVASAVMFGLISAADLLTLGGANLPTSQPPLGRNILWNQGGIVCVS